MSYLYLDTTDHMIVGFLSQDFKWLSYEESFDKKSSAKIHFLIHQLSEKFHIDLTKISGLIFVAGPGSYTGMRVTEGIGQIFKWQNVPVFSFYHYEVPSILGVSKGTWVSNAFKGQYFVYEWKDDKSQFSLLEEPEFKKDLNDLNVYTHFNKALSLDLKETSALIFQTPENFFSSVVKSRIFRPTYYYRSLENEFQVSSPLK